ncbi:MAG: hypothetical protein M3081_21145 [Gemmatimonadota bacterium]|nr:hypothetical protein [Gemmatimonadota bacterium]
MRTMPIGSDPIGFNFSVVDGKYAGVTVHPGGGTSPQHNLVATAADLTWEQPNSGGGTWMFNVRLVAADGMAGTLVLRDPPANLTPAPKGTMVLTRRPAGAPHAPPSSAALRRPDSSHVAGPSSTSSRLLTSTGSTRSATTSACRPATSRISSATR